ncbi:sugar phosphate isomerase/epimerase family protein [Paenibacillus sp. JDR-2]|uniref:sugar phosphate isomerase/epimerase family protein n=1 Tax=Paenibacillus sp. (strain JDR-2) TaxID=324057 RepID=UPI0001663D0E|nr:sugar phosphate isomerase/epimerase [Paenibacillus sp. JDR-2]ACT02605.1 Xylose isomerase domain protein TIM barrel [Paenibacillus sp. JDR-2]
MKIKYAFSRPTSSEEECRDLFQEFTKAGYDGLQLKAGQYAPYLHQPERFLEEWGHKQGIGSALITGGHIDEQGVRQLRELFRFGKKIGTELIVFCHGVSRSETRAEDIRRYAEQLSELGKEALQYGLKLSLHHHYGQPVMHREDFDIFFDRIQPGNIGLTIDTAHLVKSGITDVAELIRAYARVIDNYHMKDFAAGEWQILGRGEIYFEPIFQAILDTGYRGWISADEESGGEIAEGLTECISFLKQGLQSTR